jgi:hypothetical protein
MAVLLAVSMAVWKADSRAALWVDVMVVSLVAMMVV